MSEETKPYTILVVEDDQGVSRLVEKGLKREGFQTLVFATGTETVSWLKNNRADLMLLDLNLPDMTGGGLLDALQERRTRIPFVVMTGNGNEKLAAQFMKRGALDYITKDGAFLELLPTVVTQAIHHLRNQRDLEESQENLRKSEQLAKRQASRLATLETLSRQIASRLKDKGLLNSIVEAARNLLNADLARLHRLTPDGTSLLRTNTAGCIASSPDNRQLRVSELPIFREIISKEMSLLITDVQDDPRWAEQDWAKKERIHCYIGVPLLVEGKVDGVLSCLSRTPIFFTDADVKLMEALAAHAAVAIENARAYEELHERSERQRALQKITRDLTRKLEPSVLFDAICGAVCRLLNVEFTRLFVLDDGEEAFVGAGIFGKYELFEGYAKSFPKDKGIVARVVKEKGPVVVPEVLKDPGWMDREWAEKTGVKTYLGIPLILDGEVVGVLNSFTERVREFQDDEIDLVNSFADQAVVAIRNAELYQHVLSSEDKYRTLFDQAHDGIEIFDEAGRLIDVNQTACDIFGYTREEFLQKHLPEIVAPEFRDLVLERLRQVEKVEKGGEHYESAALRKDGITVPVEVNWGLIELEGEKRVISFVRDITERKRAEEAIRLTKFSVDRAADAVFWLAPQGNYLYVNEASCKLLGYSEEELRSKTVFDINPNMSPEKWALIWDNLKKKRSLFREDSLVAKDGRTIPVEMSANYLSFENKEYSFSFVRDITERKRAETEIRAAQLRFQSILDSASDAIISIDESQRIILFNKEAEKIFGYEFQEIVGQPLEHLMPARFRGVHPEHVKGFEADPSQSKRMSERSELYGLHKSGREFPVEVTISKIELEGKWILTAVVRDITERKRAEEELQKAHGQAQRSEKLASLGVLIAGAAHEILNPMNILSIKLQMLLQGIGADDPEKLQGAFESMLEEVRRVSRITKNLTEFSRQRETTSVLLALKELLEGVIELIEYQYKVTNVEIIKDYPDESLVIKGDKDQLTQVFLNLFANAKYAMPKGGRITLRGGSVDRASTPWARIIIEDTGTGIPKEILNRVFDPFFTTKAEGKGTGLGLSTVHGIVESHGGRIEVESVEGQGTTFTLEFPVAQEVEVQA